MHIQPRQSCSFFCTPVRKGVRDFKKSSVFFHFFLLKPSSSSSVMGSGVSKITDAIGLLPQPNNNRGALSTEKRIRFLKETPFYQYLTPETIDEFARCFTHTMRSKPGKSILLDAHHLYVVCEGEVDLSTSFPEEGSKLEAKGYLCRKRRGDIVNVCQTKEDVQRRMTVRSHRMKGLAEDIMTKGGGDTAILLLCGDVGALDKFQ